MEIRTLVSSGTDPRIIRAIDSPAVVQKIMKGVLKKALRIMDIPEDEFFVCPTIETISRGYGGENTNRTYGGKITLDGVREAAPDLSYETYKNALDELTRIYRRAIEANLPKKDIFILRVIIKLTKDVHGIPALMTSRYVIRGKLPTPSAELFIGLGGGRPAADIPHRC